MKTHRMPAALILVCCSMMFVAEPDRFESAVTRRRRPSRDFHWRGGEHGAVQKRTYL